MSEPVCLPNAPRWPYADSTTRWRTSFRQDLDLGDRYVYNVGEHGESVDLNAPLIDPHDRVPGLGRSGRVDVLCHRSLVTPIAADAELCPCDDVYVETKDRGVPHRSPHRVTARFVLASPCAACALLLVACGTAVTSDGPVAPAMPGADAGAETPPSPPSTRTDPPMSDATSSTDAPEPLYAPDHDGTRVTAGVLSFGCTSGADFRIEHELVDGACRVTLVRASPDRCRAAPRVVRVSVPWTPPPDCAGLAVEFSNPALEAPAEPATRRLPEN